MEALGAILK